MQRSKSLAMMFLLGAILVGAAMGFAADRVMMKNNLCPAPDSSAWGQQKLADYLELSPAQRTQLDSVLARRDRAFDDAVAPVKPRVDSLRAAMHDAMTTVRPRLDSIRFGARDEIRALLNPAQRARFEQRLEEQRRREELRKADDQRKRTSTKDGK